MGAAYLAAELLAALGITLTGAALTGFMTSVEFILGLGLALVFILEWWWRYRYNPGPYEDSYESSHCWHEQGQLRVKNALNQYIWLSPPFDLWSNQPRRW